MSKRVSPDKLLQAGLRTLPRIKSMMPGFEVGVFLNGSALSFSATKDGIAVGERVRSVEEPSLIATWLVQKWHKTRDSKGATG